MGLKLIRDAASNGAMNGKARARRFRVQMPLRYRVNGSAWRRGTTENISRSGVLFRAESLVEPSTALELAMALPAEVYGNGAAAVSCRGRVARTAPPADGESLPRLAATISHYRLVRP